MTNRKLINFILALCLCFRLLPFGAQAVSTESAVEPIQPEKTCSLMISYCHGSTAFSNAEVKLYRIADVTEDFHYTLMPTFEATDLLLNDVRSNSEWNVIRSTLEAHIIAHSIAPDAVSVTDQDGVAMFDDLSTGIYMAVVGQTVQDGVQCRFDSSLVSLPGLGRDGRWQYKVSVIAKGEALPPVESDEEIELKVLKLWKGDEGRTDRPQSVDVEIFRDGVSWATVTLTGENYWGYAWLTENDGASWTVVERNVPQGYKVTVEQKENTFVLTNTWIPTGTEEPGKQPETGDTSNVMLAVLLMAASGAMLVILGIAGKRTL